MKNRLGTFIAHNQGTLWMITVALAFAIAAIPTMGYTSLIIVLAMAVIFVTSNLTK